MGKDEFYSRGYYAGLAPEPRFKEILAILSQLKGERLLDVGCGDGAFTVLLKEALEAKEASGIDIAAEAVTLAQGKGIKAYQLDLDEKPFPFDDDCFDIIYCGEIIEHLFNPDHLLDEIHRVLKASGTCILTTPNLAGWPNRFALLFGYQPYPMAASPLHEGAGKWLAKGSEGQWGHIRVLTLRSLKELIKLHHFKVRSIKGCQVSINSPLPALLLGLIKFGDGVMSKFPSLATRIIAILEKE
ncbi:MAG: class I SAM-dependent methyltransferase [Dehalococcoidales bacterium]|nr:class I SAM-dependent methyltransferase [Dehalococcoidales bacterium]